PVGFDFQIVPCRDEAPQAACPDLIPEGTQIWMRGVLNEVDKGKSTLREKVNLEFFTSHGLIRKTSDREAYLPTTGFKDQLFTLTARLSEEKSSSMTISQMLNIAARPAQPISGEVSVKLGRTATAETSDMPLWTVIRAATAGISFNKYKE